LCRATDKLDMVTEPLDSLPPVLVVRNMTAIDAPGSKVLEDVASNGSGRALLFCAALCNRDS